MNHQYRKRPVVIEAFQITEQTIWVEDTWPQWMRDAWVDETLQPAQVGHKLIVKTLEGDMTADINDWIIKGVEGELYPCADRIFKATYEAVES